jgi:hypothetical protein
LLAPVCPSNLRMLLVAGLATRRSRVAWAERVEKRKKIKKCRVISDR